MDTASHTTHPGIDAAPPPSSLPVIGASILAALWCGYAVFFAIGFLTS